METIDNNFKRKINLLLKQFGLVPKNYENYFKAFTHPSKAPHPNDSYEILEFLGDSIVLIHVVLHLTQKYQKENVGVLSKAKSKIVSRESLSGIAFKLNLEKYVRIERSAYNKSNKLSPGIMADIFEGFVAAIYLDLGMRKTKKFLGQTMHDVMNEDLRESCHEDYKSILQETIQRRYKQIPVYKLIKTSGPDHDKRFFIQVFFRSVEMGKGDGRNKKEAEQKAASKTINRMDYYFKKIDQCDCDKK